MYLGKYSDEKLEHLAHQMEHDYNLSFIGKIGLYLFVVLKSPFTYLKDLILIICGMWKIITIPFAFLALFKVTLCLILCIFGFNYIVLPFEKIVVKNVFWNKGWVILFKGYRDESKPNSDLEEYKRIHKQFYGW